MCWSSSSIVRIFSEHKGCHCFAFVGCSVADHVQDLIVDYVSLCLACMVLLRLFEFFADFYDHHHRDHYSKLVGQRASAWLQYLYASSSTTSLHHHRVYFAYFVYSDNRELLQHLPRRSAA